MNQPQTALSDDIILQDIRQGHLPDDTRRNETSLSLAVRERQLAELQQDISALEQRLSALKASYSQLENRVALETAYIAPVRRLPEELLDIVFTIYTEDYPSSWSFPCISRRELPPLTLSHVCNLWREILLSQKSRWSTIVLNLDEEPDDEDADDEDEEDFPGNCLSTHNLVKLYLRNSSELPLNIWISGPSNLPLDFNPTVSSHWRVLSPIREAIGRWGCLKGDVTTLYILGVGAYFPYPRVLVDAVQSMAMPRLTSLSIYGPPKVWSRLQLSYAEYGLWFDQAPALTNLWLNVSKSPSLKAFRIPWHQIKDCYIDRCYFPKVLPVIEKMCNILSLRLHELEGFIAQDAPLVKFPNSLRQLTIAADSSLDNVPFHSFVTHKMTALNIASYPFIGWDETIEARLLTFLDVSMSSSNLQSLCLPSASIAMDDLHQIMQAVPSLTFLELWLDGLHMDQDSGSTPDTEAAVSRFMTFLSSSSNNYPLLPRLSKISLLEFQKEWSRPLLNMLRSRQPSTVGQYPRCEPIEHVKLVYHFSSAVGNDYILDGVEFDYLAVDDFEMDIAEMTMLWDGVPWPQLWDD